jgi:D-alanyl-D-alanine carboxypeptidase
MTKTAALSLPRPLSATRHVVADDAGRRTKRLGDVRRRQGRGRGPSVLVVVVAALIIAAVAVAGWAGHLFSGDGNVPFGGVVSSSAGGTPRAALDPGTLGVAGGLAPGGTTAFDVDVPAVAGLDPMLLDALQHAATDALADGVPVAVNSGWRSAAYQAQLLDEAVAQYGTPEEAARWVATPATSAHVQGDAVDIGSWDATAWFSEHGASYDLCQIYMNETWHYELRAGASSGGCPPMYRDPTQDPRLQ